MSANRRLSDSNRVCLQRTKSTRTVELGRAAALAGVKINAHAPRPGGRYLLVLLRSIQRPPAFVAQRWLSSNG
jgi:hypothetical protein